MRLAPAKEWFGSYLHGLARSPSGTKASHKMNMLSAQDCMRALGLHARLAAAVHDCLATPRSPEQAHSLGRARLLCSALRSAFPPPCVPLHAQLLRTACPTRLPPARHQTLGRCCPSGGSEPAVLACQTRACHPARPSRAAAGCRSSCARGLRTACPCRTLLRRCEHATAAASGLHASRGPVSMCRYTCNPQACLSMHTSNMKGALGTSVRP